MPEPTPVFKLPYVTAEQQRSAATFGLWIFLSTEMLLFGPLFLAFAIYHHAAPKAFALAAARTLLVPGAINTALLLLSSFLVANAAAEAARRPRYAAKLFLTAAGLGLLFLAVKTAEYAHEIREHLFPGPDFHAPDTSQMFFVIYFTITALHAVHVLIGVGLLSTFGLRLLRTREPARVESAFPLVALYEHFVTFIWLFVFAVFYLGSRP